MIQVLDAIGEGEEEAEDFKKPQVDSPALMYSKKVCTGTESANTGVPCQEKSMLSYKKEPVTTTW